MNLLIGDSHVGNICSKSIQTICKPSTSAKGLNNPISISGCNTFIIDNVKNNNYDNLFFLFGSVDVDFCFIHKYLENTDIDYKEFNLNVVNNYLEFINNNFYDKSVIILSVGLPTLDDEKLKPFILSQYHIVENVDLIIFEDKLSKCELPDIYKRTEITLHFNEMLKEKIIELNNPNIKYLDAVTFSYDCELKRIKDEFFTRIDNHNWERGPHIIEIIDLYLSNSYLHTLQN